LAAASVIDANPSRTIVTNKTAREIENGCRICCACRVRATGIFHEIVVCYRQNVEEACAKVTATSCTIGGGLGNASGSANKTGNEIAKVSSNAPCHDGA